MLMPAPTKRSVMLAMLGSVPAKLLYWICHGSVSVRTVALPPVQEASAALEMLPILALSVFVMVLLEKLPSSVRLQLTDSDSATNLIGVQAVLSPLSLSSSLVADPAPEYSERTKAVIRATSMNRRMSMSEDIALLSFDVSSCDDLAYAMRGAPRGCRPDSYPEGRGGLAGIGAGRSSSMPPSATVERMAIQRMDHVGIVVDDLAAATAFFVELGLELQGEAQVEGGWVDRVVGLEGVQAEIAMLETPDGHGRIEMAKFDAPSDPGGDRQAPSNAVGIRHVAFRVDDIDAVVAGLRAHGGELVGEIERYKDIYRLCYVRGPEGIIVELAQRIG